MSRARFVVLVILIVVSAASFCAVLMFDASERGAFMRECAAKSPPDACAEAWRMLDEKPEFGR